MKRIMTLFLVISTLLTLFCPALSVDAASTFPVKELYFDFDGTEDYATWCGMGTQPLIENGMYRLVTDTVVANDGFYMPDCENFTIEARIRYSNTAPRHHIYTKNNGIFIHMLYDGVYVENGKEKIYSDEVDIGKDWHDWKLRFFNDGKNFEIYLDGNLILEGETEHSSGTFSPRDFYTIYKVGDVGEAYGVFEMDWRRYAPDLNPEPVGLGFDVSTDKTEYTEGEDVTVGTTHVISEGMDNIYAISSGTWTHYARQVGSDGDWTEIASGQTETAQVNKKTSNLNSGLAINSIIAYKKSSSGDIAYASGDTVYASFDADDSASLAKAYVSADADGNAGQVKTFTCQGEKYAYAYGGSGYLDIPFCPTFYLGTLYIQFRTHAVTDASNDKHTYMYFNGKQRVAKNLTADVYRSVNDGLSLKPDVGDTTIPEINYLIDGQVVAVGKGEDGYTATISGLKAGNYSVYAEYGGKTTNALDFKVVSAADGALKVSKTSENSAEVSLECDDQTSDIESVEFFVDGNSVATKNEMPFSTEISFASGTTHTVSAIAKGDSGVILGKYSTPVFPNLSGDNTTTNYANEIRYSVSGSSGSATVNVSNGTHKLFLTHTKNGFTYLSDKGEESFDCGVGDFIVMTDAYAADVYYNGMLVKSFTMPMTTDVTKSITNNGLSIENFAITVPEEKVTYFARNNIENEDSYTELAYLPYSYVADLVMDRNHNVRFYIKDGKFRADVKIEGGKVYAIAKLRKMYYSELGSYSEDAAPTWRMLGELPEMHGDICIRVETVGGISRIYANDVQIGVFRGIVLAGGAGVAFDVEKGSSVKKFTISDASDVYYYEDEFDNDGSYETSDFWTADGVDFTVGDNVVASFDADNPTDVAGLTVDAGNTVKTVTYGGETYVHASAGHLYIPIAPAVPENEPIYVKLRVHAVKLEKFGAGTVLNVYTTNSGGKQISEYINDGDLKTSGLVSDDINDPGLDIIFKLNPNTEDGYGFYMRHVGSDGEWMAINEAKAYNINSVLQKIRVGYNLAVSDVKVYRESDAADDSIDNGGKVTMDSTGVAGGWATIDVAASKVDASADVKITNENGGFWFIFGKQDTLGGFVGYNFETKKFELGETVRGNTVKIAEVDGTLPVGETVNWRLKTRRDKEQDNELVELYINGEKVISGNSTCHNNGLLGFASSENKAYIYNFKYRGNSKPVMGMLVYQNLGGAPGYSLARGFMTDEGTYFVGENKTDYLFTDDGGKTFTNVPYDNAGVKLFNSFVPLDNGDILGIDHGIFHPVAIEGGTGYLQYVYISKDEGKSWQQYSIICPDKPAQTGMPNRAFKTSTGRIIIARGEIADSDGWEAEDWGSESIAYSDDNGLTWKTTDIVRSQEIGMVLAESVALERSDGSIRLFFRSGPGSINYIDSHDNGATFDFSFVGSTPFESNVNCFNITKDPTNPTTWWATWGYDWGYDKLPNAQFPRERYAVAVSYDEGTTWDYVGTVKDANYDHARYGNIAGNNMNASLFVDDKAVYVIFYGTEEGYVGSDKSNYVDYTYVIDKSKIVPTKSWEKLHLRNEFYMVDGSLEYIMEQDKLEKTMLVGTDTDNLFFNKEFYDSGASNGNIQAEFAAAFVGADVKIEGNSVVLIRSGVEVVFDGESVMQAKGKTFISTEDFAEQYNYRLYEQDGYKIVSKAMGWREDDNEVFRYTVGDYIEPKLYEPEKKKNAWREYLKELEGEVIVDADYRDGDYVVESFDADNQADIAGLTTSDNDTIETATFGGETYAYKTKSEGYLYIPIAPAIPAGEPVYMKLRLHARNSGSGGSNLNVYTKSSGGRQITEYINDGDLGIEGLLSANPQDAGLDIILKLNPGSGAGYDFYVRPADSDGEWTVISENKEYLINSALQVMRVGYNLAVSDVKVYKKVDDATAAFNAASKKEDAAAMEDVLLSYAITYGIDLTKLDEVVNNTAVYARLFNLSFGTASEVAAAFNRAVTAQIESEFTYDYAVGDSVKQTFHADNATDVAQLVSSDGSGVSTVTLGGETYAYTTGTGSLNIPQILPGVPSAEPIFVKLRLHALSNKNAGNAVYVHTWSSQGKRANQNMTDADLGTSGVVSADADDAGFDVIFKFNPNNENGFGVYVRRADSDGEWTTVHEGKTYAYTTAYDSLMIYNNMAISSAIVYTKIPKTIKLKRTSVTSEKWSFEVSTEAKFSSGTVYVGAYDENDVLLGAAFEDFNTVGSTALDLPIPTTGTVKYFKAFIWDENLMPIGKSARINI